MRLEVYEEKSRIMIARSKPWLMKTKTWKPRSKPWLTATNTWKLEWAVSNRRMVYWTALVSMLQHCASSSSWESQCPSSPRMKVYSRSSEIGRSAWISRFTRPVIMLSSALFSNTQIPQHSIRKERHASNVYAIRSARSSNAFSASRRGLRRIAFVTIPNVSSYLTISCTSTNLYFRRESSWACPIRRPIQCYRRVKKVQWFSCYWSRTQRIPRVCCSTMYQTGAKHRQIRTAEAIVQRGCPSTFNRAKQPP